MVVRRYEALEIAAPFAQRLKSRLERSVAHAIVNPSRALPTLRRAVLVAAAELRRLDYGDDQIRDLFTQLIEDVVRARAINANSIVSGQPRWIEVRDKVVLWACTPGTNEHEDTSSL